MNGSPEQTGPKQPSLYVTEVISPNLVIHRSNPDLTPDMRKDIIAARRLAQLTGFFGADAELFFT